MRGMGPSGRRVIQVVAAACLLAGSARAELVDRVVAVVNGEPIALSEVETRAAPELAQLQRVEPQRRAQVRRKIIAEAVEVVIAEKLLEQQTKELGIEVTDQEVELALEDVQKQNNFDRDQLEQALSQEGHTLASYREYMRNHLRRMKLMNLKVRSKVKVSEQDLRATYDRWARTESSDAEVRARHILVKFPEGAPADQVEAARQKAAAIAALARQAGTDFAALAKSRSEAASAEDGGDLGFFRRGTMLPEFDKVVFKLEPGQVSEPIRTPSGFHVVKVEERRAAPVRSFEEMKGQLSDRLGREQLERYSQQYVKELRQKAAVEVKL